MTMTNSAPRQLLCSSHVWCLNMPQKLSCLVVSGYLRLSPWVLWGQVALYLRCCCVNQPNVQEMPGDHQGYQQDFHVEVKSYEAKLLSLVYLVWFWFRNLMCSKNTKSKRCVKSNSVYGCMVRFWARAMKATAMKTMKIGTRRWKDSKPEFKFITGRYNVVISWLNQDFQEDLHSEAQLCEINAFKCLQVLVINAFCPFLQDIKTSLAWRWGMLPDDFQEDSHKEMWNQIPITDAQPRNLIDTDQDTNGHDEALLASRVYICQHIYPMARSNYQLRITLNLNGTRLGWFFLQQYQKSVSGCFKIVSRMLTNGQTLTWRPGCFQIYILYICKKNSWARFSLCFIKAQSDAVAIACHAGCRWRPGRETGLLDWGWNECGLLNIRILSVCQVEAPEGDPDLVREADHPGLQAQRFFL